MIGELPEAAPVVIIGNRQGAVRGANDHGQSVRRIAKLVPASASERPFPDGAIDRRGDNAIARCGDIDGLDLDECTADAGRAPTFVGVDFYDEGDLFAVVRKANGL